MDPFAAVAWPMRVVPTDQKVTTSRRWQARKKLMGGQLLREEAESVELAVVEEEVVEMEAPMLLNGLASMTALLVDSPPKAINSQIYLFIYLNIKQKII